MKHLSPLDRYAAVNLPPIPRGTAPVAEHAVVGEVMQGKRFVTYPYVVSILVLSFNRTLGGVRVVETGNRRMGPLFGAAAITGLFGWWGFP